MMIPGLLSPGLGRSHCGERGMGLSGPVKSANVKQETDKTCCKTLKLLYDTDNMKCTLFHKRNEDRVTHRNARQLIAIPRKGNQIFVTFNELK